MNNLYSFAHDYIVNISKRSNNSLSAPSSILSMKIRETSTLHRTDRTNDRCMW